MKCVICNGVMFYSFSKIFNALGLTKVDYWRCEDCGFSMSKTHADMTASEWASLNHEYHSTFHGKEFCPDDPRWIMRLQTQAKVLDDSATIGLLNGGGQWLDYACGDGKLSVLLENEGRKLLNYDRYMPSREGYLNDDQISGSQFDFVITTSVFEHFTRKNTSTQSRHWLPRIGVLGLHTLVCETVPRDASWFYLLPVHCAFHTNKSMSLLFRQWGYASSVYNVDARLWLWFKEPLRIYRAEFTMRIVEPNGPTYILKDGFMDYWK